MWFGGSPAPSNGGQCDDGAQHHNARRGRTRINIPPDSCVDDIVGTLKHWESQHPCAVGGVAVQYNVESVTIERRIHQAEHVRIAIKAHAGDVAVVEELRPMRIGKIRAHGIPFPPQLHWRLICQSLSARETVRLGVQVSLDRFVCHGTDGSRLGHQMAVFRYAGVFNDEACTVPHEEWVRVDNVVSGNTTMLGCTAESFKQLHMPDDVLAHHCINGCGGELIGSLVTEHNTARSRRAHEQSSMAREDMAAAAVGLCAPHALQLVHVMHDIPRDVCADAITLKCWLGNEKDKLKVAVWPPDEHMRWRLWSIFSGYCARGRTDSTDAVIFEHCATIKTGCTTARRVAVLAVESFIEHTCIQGNDITRHPYVNFVMDFFAKYGLAPARTALDPESLFYRLDRDRNDRIDVTLELAMEKEFGSWPFRSGTLPWSAHAVRRCACTLAFCSRAPFLSHASPIPEIEAVYKCLCELAAAHHAHSVNQVNMPDSTSTIITDYELARRRYDVMCFRARQASRLLDPIGPPEGVMPPMYGYDWHSEGEGCGDKSSTESEESCGAQGSVVIVEADSNEFVLKQQDGGAGVRLHDSMRARSATWHGIGGRELKFRPRDWTGPGHTSIAWMAPFVWSFDTACAELDAALHDHIVQQPGVVIDAADRAGEFAAPLAAARGRRARAHGKRARPPYAVGMRTTPPHVVLLTV